MQATSSSKLLTQTAQSLYTSIMNSGMQDCYKLKNLVRYNHRTRIKDESVAEHSFFVSLFCMKLLASLDVTNEIRLRVLETAILHDVAEYETSDLPHDVKVKYPAINRLLKLIEDDFYKENYPSYVGLFSDPIIMSSSQAIERELIHNIVKVADLASVIQFCKNERMLGNISSDIVSIEDDAHKRMVVLMNNIAYAVDISLKGVINYAKEQ